MFFWYTLDLAAGCISKLGHQGLPPTGTHHLEGSSSKLSLHDLHVFCGHFSRSSQEGSQGFPKGIVTSIHQPWSGGRKLSIYSRRGISLGDSITKGHGSCWDGRCFGQWTRLAYDHRVAAGLWFLGLKLIGWSCLVTWKLLLDYQTIFQYMMVGSETASRPSTIWLNGKFLRHPPVQEKIIQKTCQYPTNVWCCCCLIPYQKCTIWGVLEIPSFLSPVLTTHKPCSHPPLHCHSRPLTSINHG